MDTVGRMDIYIYFDSQLHMNNILSYIMCATQILFYIKIILTSCGVYYESFWGLKLGYVPLQYILAMACTYSSIYVI